MRHQRRGVFSKLAILIASFALLCSIAHPLATQAEPPNDSVKVPQPVTLVNDPSDGWESRLATWRSNILPSIADFETEMWDRDSGVTGRQIMNFAAAVAREGQDSGRAWEALQLIFDHQYMDPNSADYGSFTHDIWGNCWYGLECYELFVPAYTSTTPGSYASISQTADVTTPGEHILDLKLRTNFTYTHANYHYFEVLVNNELVYKEDAVSAGSSWRDLSLDVTAAVGTSQQANVELRLYEERAVAQHPVSVRFDQITLSGTDLNGAVDQPGIWTEDAGGTGVGVHIGTSSPTVNSTSFMLMLLAGIINSTDFDLFTPQQQQLILERAKIASWSRLNDPHGQVTYTNARLARDMHMILIGQASGDSDLYQQGVDFWDEWFAYTQEWGIREYGSVTYYGVDLNMLMAGHSYIEDETLREEFGDALDLIWYDMAANWFPGHNSVSGSQSRNYNFTHPGTPRTYTTVEGWEEMPTTFGGGDYQVFQGFYGDHVYHPDRETYDVAMTPVKEVTALTDPNRFLDRYNYVTPHWALGSTSETFTNTIPGFGAPSPYDKPINMEFVGGRAMGSIAIVPSWNTDPYGKVRYHHAPLFPTTAQHQGSVLTQLDLNPSGQRVPNFSTHVLLPQSADLVLVDGLAVDMSQLGETPAALDSTLVVKVGQGCAAIRILGAEGIHGQTPTAALVVDQPGLDIEMARFTIQQFDSPSSETLTTESAPVTMFIQGSDCATTAEAEALGAAVAGLPVSQSDSGTVRTATITTHDGTVLEVATDTVARDPLYRSVNGTPMLAPSILAVNGRDYSAVIDD